MDYSNEGNKRDEGGPVIGKLGASFKKTSPFGKPLFSKTAGSIRERIRNLSKKDLAFVVVGLSVLVAAPVAEYLMSKPTSDNQLTSGFGARGDGDSSLYEPGINSLSQGSPDGSGEVITPLSARDPASLIIGSQPSAPAPVTPPPPSSGFRDAMKDAGRQAFSDVAKSAGAPVPIPKMQSGLRGVGSFLGGEGGGSRTSGGVDGRIMSDARNASGKAAQRSMLSPKAAVDYKGVAYKPGAASRGALEKLRAQAARSAMHFSDGGATGALDRAASESPEAHGVGTRGPGVADDIKSPAGHDGHGKHSFTAPENLDNLAAKFRLQKHLEWEEYLKHGIAKDIISACVGAFGTSLGKFVGNTTDSLLGQSGGGAPTYYCAEPINPNVKPEPCIKGNVHIKFSSNDPKTVDSWNNPNKIICPCSVWRKDEYESTFGGGGPAPNPTVSPEPSPNPTASPSPSPTSAPQPVRELFGAYDEVLKQMYIARTDGQKAPDAVALLNKTMEVAGGFANLKATEVVSKINASGRNVVQGELADYANRISEVKMDVSATRSSYNIFRVKFDNVMAAAKNGTLVLGSAAGQYGPKASLSDAVLPYLNTAEQSFPILEENFLGKAEKQIAYNEKALAAYQQHVGFASGVAGQINTEYTGADGVLKAAEQIYGELKLIKDGLAPNTAPTAQQQDTIINYYKVVSGLDPSVKPPDAPVVPAGPAVITSVKALDAYAAAFNTKSADFRDQAASPRQQAGLIARPIAWRGLKADTPFTQEGKANDADAVKAEREAWKKVTPLLKKTEEEIQAENNVPPSLLAASMRNMSEIPADVKAQSVDPTATASLAAHVKERMGAITKQLTSAAPDGYGINMDNPSGGAAPSPSPSPSPSPAPQPGGGSGGTTNININNQLTGNGSGTAAPKDLPLQIAASRKAAGDNLSQMTATAQAADATYDKFPTSRCKVGECQRAFGKAQQYRAALNENVAAVRNLQKELENPDLTQADVERINRGLATQRSEANRNKEQFDQYLDRADQLRTKPSSGGTTPPAASPTPAAVKPPASIDQVGLVKGRTTIPAYDGKGQPLMVDKCVEWGVGWVSGFTSQPVCRKYVKVQVTVTVNDYYISYGQGEPLPLSAKMAWASTGSQALQTSGGKVYYQDASIKRQEYDMEVKISCVRQGNGWVISYAGLRKGLASSSDALGGRVSAGWNLGPTVIAEINYSRSWNHFRNGEMLPYDGLVNRACR